MSHPHHPLYVAGRAEFRDETLAVHNKFTGAVAGTVSLADPSDIEEAIAAAASVVAEMGSLPLHRRRDVLRHCATRLAERSEELVHLLAVEVGKPLADGRAEVSRLIATFDAAASEALGDIGAVIPVDTHPTAERHRAVWRRMPIGACSFITPFNFPLNLVAHKVAPAIAVGCPFVLKPASRTPMSALVIGEVLSETDLPSGAFSILPCGRSDAGAFATDPRFAFLSFTGSAAVGWDLKARAGRKQVSLELGGNAACVVDADTDVDDAAQRIAAGTFSQAGQSCISVQRIIVHEAIYDALKARLAAHATGLVMGDPLDEATRLGPMISEDEARRVESWIGEAVELGGRIVCGGGRRGPMVEATLLEDVPEEAAVCAREVFGPVGVLSRFSDFDDALARVNRSEYGLQAGVFTRDIHRAHRAWDTLEVGGVIIGDIPSWRVDHMPYGGVKASGIGREGVRYAMEEMTEIRLMVTRDHG